MLGTKGTACVNIVLINSVPEHVRGACVMSVTFVAHTVHVERLSRMQNVAGSSPARGSSSFSLEKRELSSGGVICICLVSMTDYSCTCT